MKHIQYVVLLITLVLTGCAAPIQTAVLPTEVSVLDTTVDIQEPPEPIEYDYIDTTYPEPLLPPPVVDSYSKRENAGLYKTKLNPFIGNVEEYRDYVNRYLEEAYKSIGEKDIILQKKACSNLANFLPKPKQLPIFKVEGSNPSELAIQEELGSYIKELLKYIKTNNNKTNKAMSEYKKYCQ